MRRMNTIRASVLFGLAGLVGCTPQISGVERNRGGAALTMFSASSTPSQTNVDAGYDFELGMIFFADSAGTANGVHFYKGDADTGTHTGHLWTASGTLLATVTFSGETASGWQYMAFSSPVSLNAGTRYVVSYHTTTGFSLDQNYFTSQVDNPPLHVPAGGGVYGAGSTFPSQVYADSNYWVDVDYTAGSGTTTGGGGNTTLFDPATSPASEATNTDPEEVGVKFTVDNTGTVHGIRFYKTPNDTGTHVGHLWDQYGNLLTSATFTNETASGWQEQAVSVPIEPGQTYTASYGTATDFGFDFGGFNAGIDRAPLHAPANGGVMGLQGSYPQGNFYADNFWVDVHFDSAACTPGCSACGASDGCGGTCCAGSAYSIWTVNDAPSSVGSGNFELGTTFTAAVDGTVTHLRYYNAAGDATAHDGHLWDGSGNLLATVNFPANSPQGWLDQPLASPVQIVANKSYVVSYYTTNSFAYTPDYLDSPRSVLPLTVPAQGGVYGTGPDGTFPTQSFSGSSYFADVVFQPTPKVASLFGATSLPSATLQSSGTPFEVGVQFTTSVAGAVTQLLFYKGAGNSGAHVAHLWDGSGTLLATAPYTNETASGWQSVVLPSAIPLTTGTQYVASYSSSTGIAADQAFFGPNFDRPPLSVPTSGGVYATAIDTFPDQTFGGSNYWVDVTFQPTLPNQSCTPTCAGVACGQPDGCGGTCCSGSGCTAATGCDPQCQTLNTCGSACQNVADNTSCTPSAGGAGTCQSGACTAGSLSSVFNDTGAPNSSYISSDAFELGMQFTSDLATTVTKLRFFKVAGATGTHVGHLWDGAGNLLATATYTNETASGWQEVTLSAPVAINANTEYVTSYSESGGFGFTLDYFDSAKDVPPLHVPASGGVYGAQGSFPTLVYLNSNYWVDAVISN
jgi:Domain of unknown function (DUF4082)